jgi:hypothetical protein
MMPLITSFISIWQAPTCPKHQTQMILTGSFPMEEYVCLQCREENHDNTKAV